MIPTKIRRMLRDRGVGRRHMDVDLDHAKIKGQPYTDVVKQYCVNLEDRISDGKGLLLTGPYGSGKTGLAVIVMAHVCHKAVEDHDRRYDCQMIVAGDFVRIMIDRPKWFDQNLADRLREVPFLVVDNVNSSLEGAWSSGVFETLLRHRWDDMLPTIITTNLQAADTFKVVTEAGFELVKDSCKPVKVEGVQWREKME